LLLTNSVKDTIVKDIVEVMFRAFPNPLQICRTPSKFIDFLTSKAKDFSPLDASFDASTSAIPKGPNYCYQKAKYIVSMSKKLVLIWCQAKITTFSTLPILEEKYCNMKNLQESLCSPLPEPWIEKCEESIDTLFPFKYSKDFFCGLPGIGLKMRHLCAEAIYEVVVGPAIDCHCIRFGVEMGTIHASMNIEQMSTCLVSLYRNDQLVSLNEIPATISQIMTSKGAKTMEFAESLCSIGKQHGLYENMNAFLRHYYRPQV
jgi:endonuclease III